MHPCDQKHDLHKCGVWTWADFQAWRMHVKPSFLGLSVVVILQIVLFIWWASPGNFALLNSEVKYCKALRVIRCKPDKARAEESSNIRNLTLADASPFAIRNSSSLTSYPRVCMQGCYAALLRPRDLQQRSGSLAGAIQRVLRQFSGADEAGGCDMVVSPRLTKCFGLRGRPSASAAAICP